MIPGYMEDEYARLRAEGSALKSGVIDRSGNLEHPALSSVVPAGGALSNAAPPVPPTGQAQTEYPPAPSTQASSQGLAGAAPIADGTPFGPGASTTPAQKKKPRTAKTMFEESNPLDIADNLDASVTAMKNTAKENPQAFKQVEAALTLKGIDTEAAFYDMRDNFIDAAAKRREGRKSKVYSETEFKKRWKNVFNIIPREQMGMFLFDFGLRMMAASSQPGSAVAHAGIAGAGALGGVQAKQARDEEMAMKDEEMASEQAGALIGMEQQQQQIGIQGRQADTAEQARIDEEAYRNEQNRLKGRELDIDEKRAKAGLTASGERNEFAHENLFALYKKVGYSDREAGDLIAGAKTEAEIRFSIMQAFNDDKANNVKDVPPGGSEAKRLRDFTQKERQAYIDSMIKYVRFGGGGGGGALSGGSTAPQRPEGWNEYP